MLDFNTKMSKTDEERRLKEFFKKHRPLDWVPLGRKRGKARIEALRVVDEYPNISSIEFWKLMNGRGFAIGNDYARKLKQRAIKDRAILSRPRKRKTIPIIKKPKLKSFNVKVWFDNELFSPFDGVLVTDFIYLDSVKEGIINDILNPIRGLCVNYGNDGRHFVCYLPFKSHESGFLTGSSKGIHVGFRVPHRFSGLNRACFAFLQESNEDGSPRFLIQDRSKRHYRTEQIEFDSLETAVTFFHYVFDGYRKWDLFFRLRVKELCGFHGRGHKTKSLFKKSQRRKNNNSPKMTKIRLTS